MLSSKHNVSKRYIYRLLISLERYPWSFFGAMSFKNFLFGKIPYLLIIFWCYVLRNYLFGMTSFVLLIFWCYVFQELLIWEDLICIDHLLVLCVWETSYLETSHIYWSSFGAMCWGTTYLFHLLLAINVPFLYGRRNPNSFIVQLA